MYSQTTPSYRRDFESPGRQTVTSPSLSKIAQLNDKVRSIQPAFEETRSAKREIFQNKIRYIDDRLNKTESQNDQKFKLLAEQLNKIQDGANQETFAKEVLAEKRLKEIKLLDKDFSLNISKEHQEKKENETKMLRQIDEKIQEMKVELFRDRKKREDYEVFRASEIENKINDLYESFEIEKRTRDEVSDNLIKTFGEEVIKFQELLCQEKKVREDQHNGMLKVLQELNDSLSSDVAQEKQVREKSEEMLLKLLEDTCAKIETTLLKDDE